MMEQPQLWLVWIGAFFLGVSALVALYRALRGPGILDRMVASDVVLTTVVLAFGVDMVLNQHTTSITIMTVVTAAAAFATITVARYVRKNSSAEPQSLDTHDGSLSEKASGDAARLHALRDDHEEPATARHHSAGDASGGAK